MNKKDDKLGMNRPIKRRDFIGGVAVALSGSLASRPWAQVETFTEPPGAGPSLPTDASTYPPLRSGLRGSHAGSFEVAHQLRNGERWDSEDVEDSGETYDLVVVGGGISGLAAAWYYREEKPDARILVLDNHDDFGGHAKRNEFRLGDRTLLSNGGTMNIENFNEYSANAQHLIRSIGIEPERYSDYYDKKIHSSLKLSSGVYFNSDTFAANRVVAGEGLPNWPAYLARTPLPPAVQKDIARLYESNVDYLAGMSLPEKREELRKMSYNEFLTRHAGALPESLAYLNRDGYWAIGNDALSAWAAVAGDAAGTQGLGFGGDDEERMYFQFPDGNASVARLLAQSLIPAAAPGVGMENIVTAAFDYSRLDVPGQPVRFRLNSTAIDVRHLGDAGQARAVEITYVQGGRAQRVKAAHTVLACYNSMIPYLCDELPAAQKTALSQSLKAPLVYTNVVIRNWRAFAELGINRLRCPGSYFDSLRLCPPISIGKYQHPQSPDDATIVQMYRTPLAPGLPAQQQWMAGRRELLSADFESFERQVRDQLDKILSPAGFNAARDIEAITVNRWPHGYAYGQNPETGEIAYLLDEVPEDIAPWIQGRKPHGRIAIANSDAAANAMTESAIEQAYRAASELLNG